MSHRIKCSYTDLFIKPIAILGCLLGLLWLYCLVFMACVPARKRKIISTSILSGDVRCWCCGRQIQPQSANTHPVASHRQDYIAQPPPQSDLSNWTKIEDYSRLISILGNFHTIGTSSLRFRLQLPSLLVLLFWSKNSNKENVKLLLYDEGCMFVRPWPRSQYNQ